MSNLALNPAPHPVSDHRDRVIASLEQENKNLQEELEEARKEAARANQIAQRTVAELRRQLLPLFQALKAVFGEIDAVVAEGSEHESPRPSVSRKSEAWEAWKRKLGGKAAEFITELQIHGEMTGQQLKVATRCAQQTVYDTIAKLNKAQLLNKTGSKYSLKEI